MVCQPPTRSLDHITIQQTHGFWCSVCWELHHFCWDGHVKRGPGTISLLAVRPGDGASFAGSGGACRYPGVSTRGEIIWYLSWDPLGILISYSDEWIWMGYIMWLKQFYKLPKLGISVCWLNSSSKWSILISVANLVGGLEPWNFMTFHWEFHHPNWRSHIVQRGSNHQPVSYSDEWDSRDSQDLLWFFGYFFDDIGNVFTHIDHNGTFGIFWHNIVIS